MSGLIHERAYNQWIDIPGDTSSLYDDGVSIDAGTAMILASNEAHLSQESLHHHVMDASRLLFDPGGGKDTWTDVADVAGPSAASVAALPLDEAYKSVSWMIRYRRWGPFFPIFDRLSTDGQSVCRSLRIVANFFNSGGSTAIAHAIVTTHNDPQLVAQGDVAGYYRTDITGAGAQILEWAPNIDMRDAQRELIQSRAGTSTTGPTHFGFVPLYVWISAQSAVTTMYTCSIFEVR